MSKPAKAEYQTPGEPRNPTRPEHLDWLAQQLDGRMQQGIGPTQNVVKEVAFILRQWAESQRRDARERIEHHKQRKHRQMDLEADH